MPSVALPQPRLGRISSFTSEYKSFPNPSTLGRLALGGQTANQQIEELRRIHIYRHGGVGYVAIPHYRRGSGTGKSGCRSTNRHVHRCWLLFHLGLPPQVTGAWAVAQGLSRSEFAVYFYIDVILFERQDRRIEKCGDRERIVHIRPHQKALRAVTVDGIAANLRRSLTDRILRGFERAHVLFGERSLAGSIQADHGDRNAGLKHN